MCVFSLGCYELYLSLLRFAVALMFFNISIVAICSSKYPVQKFCPGTTGGTTPKFLGGPRGCQKRPLPNDHGHNYRDL